MIILITFIETHPATGRKTTLVSHGVDSLTDKVIILPQQTPESMGAVFDPSMGEYILKDPTI